MVTFGGYVNMIHVQDGVTFAASEGDTERCIYRLNADVTHNMIISQHIKEIFIFRSKK
jgi:hypothetical protein